MAANLRRYVEAGYRPLGGSFEASTSIFRLGSGDRRILPLRCERGGQYAIVAVSEGMEDLDLAVIDRDSKLVAADGSFGPAPAVAFQAESAATYYLFVRNSTDQDALVIVTRLKK
jgi:hypothetical protein